MKTTQATGRTVEEAVSSGLAELGLPADRVAVEILEEASKGFLGIGTRPARVRLTEKPTVIAEPAKPAPENATEQVKVDAPAPVSAAVPAAQREPMKPRSPVQRTQKTVKADPAPADVKARAFLEGLFAQMAFEAVLNVSADEEQVNIVIEGEDTSVFVGHHGETLDALQYLTSLHVNRGQSNYTRVHIDTAGYRARREDALVKLAARMAEKAIKTNRRVAMEPMNPYERRILHSSLQDTPGVTTFSEGEEPMRRVVIAPKRA